MRIVAALLLSTSLVWADGNADRAKALFDEGRALMKQEKWDTACAKLAESFELENAMGTKLNLAECTARQGKLLRAYNLFKEVADGDDNDKRMVVARERMAQLEQKLAKVKITISAKARSEGVELLIDGVAVDESLDKPIVRVLPPGEVTITARAKGHPDFEKKPRLDEGEQFTITIPGFAAVEHLREGPRRHSRVMLSLGLGIGGLATLVAGGIAGRIGQSDFKATLDSGRCSPGLGVYVCSEQGRIELEDAKFLVDTANVLAIAGGVLIVGAAVVFLTAPRDPVPTAIAVTPVVSPDYAGVVFGASF